MKVKAAYMTYHPKIKDANGLEIKESIALLEKKNIGGIGQWLLLRGKSIHNPILLFLHGGPGSAEWPLLKKYNSELEDHFVIVYWEQRGAGKTYSSKTQNMNIEQFISDTHEIVEYLRGNFGKKKVFIIGHSWGSIIGILTAQRYPELFYAYVGMGQFVHGKDNESISYQYVMDIAQKSHNRKALSRLNEINQPEIYGTIDQEGKWYKKLLIQRDYLYQFGGCIHRKSKFLDWAIPFFLTYSIIDLIKYNSGYFDSMKKLWPEIMNCNLLMQVPKLEIPIYFLVGRYDYNTPFELVEKYYNQLIAPKKTLIWFENSSHNPHYEEAQKFNDILINEIRREMNN
jgi:pimeloyl-ACP methyl ester carboxylesterase